MHNPGKIRPLLAVFPILLACALGEQSPAVGDTSPMPREGRATIQDKSGATTVPFDLKGGHIYLDGRINGKPARFVLDSGAGGDILTPAAAAHFGVQLADDHPIKALGAGGTQDAQAAIERKVEIGDAVLEQEPAFVIALPDALGCDGLLGYSLLRRFIATIDYEKKTLTLTDPKRFTVPQGATTLALSLAEGGLPVIDGTVDGIKGRFHIDTGAGSGLTLFRPFVERNGLRDKYTPRIETITGRGVGGYLRGDLVRIKSLTLGDATLPSVVAELSRQTTGVFADEHSAGNIGAEVLSRFTVTLDYPRKRLYLTRNTHFGDPFSTNRSGISLDKDHDRVFVAAVVPGSPGAEAGILTGDDLIAIDGVGVDKIDPETLRDRLREAPGTRVEMTVRTGDNGAPRKAVVTLRDLL